MGRIERIERKERIERIVSLLCQHGPVCQKCVVFQGIYALNELNELL